MPKAVDGRAIGTAFCRADAEEGASVAKLIELLNLAMNANGDGTVSRDKFMRKVDDLFAKLHTKKNAELTRDELTELPLKLLPTGKR